MMTKHTPINFEDNQSTNVPWMGSGSCPTTSEPVVVVSEGTESVRTTVLGARNKN